MPGLVGCCVTAVAFVAAFSIGWVSQRFDVRVPVPEVLAGTWNVTGVQPMDMDQVRVHEVVLSGGLPQSPLVPPTSAAALPFSSLNHTLLSEVLGAIAAKTQQEGGASGDLLRRLAPLPHFQAAVGPSRRRLHFLHISRPAAGICSLDGSCPTVAVLAVHGWPGSFLEFLGDGAGVKGGFVGALAAAPELAEVNLQVVVPSLPGYGFSEPLPANSVRGMAYTLHSLMLQLGLGADSAAGGYFVQGGDWGSMVGEVLLRVACGHVRGYHTNMALPGLAHDTLGSLAEAGVSPGRGPDAARLAAVGMAPGSTTWLAALLQSSGYFHQQATQPGTLATAILAPSTRVGADGRVQVAAEGIAAWLLEKYDTWSECGLFQEAMASWTASEGKSPSLGAGASRDVASCLGLQALADAITLYGMTDTLGSSMSTYRDTATDAAFWAMLYQRPGTPVPVAIADMPGERLLRFPFQALHTQHKRNLVQFTRFPYGGHFAAWEVPGPLARDVAAFIADVMQGKAQPVVDTAGAMGEQGGASGGAGGGGEDL